MTTFTDSIALAGAGALTTVPGTPIFTDTASFSAAGGLIITGPIGTAEFDSAGVIVNSFDLTLPTGLVDGNYGILLFGWPTGDGDPVPVTATGWDYLIPPVTSNEVTFAALKKVFHTGDDAAPLTISFGHGVAVLCLGVWYDQMTDVDTIGVYGQRGGVSSDMITAPSLTTASVANARLLSLFAERSLQTGTEVTLARGGELLLFKEGSAVGAASIFLAERAVSGVTATGDETAIYTHYSGSGIGVQVAFVMSNSVRERPADPLGTEGTLSATGTVIGGSFGGIPTSANTPAGTSLVLAVPSGLVADSYLLAVIGARDVGNWTVPDGWYDGGQQVDAQDLRVYFHYVDDPALEPVSYTWVTDTASRLLGLMWAQPAEPNVTPVDYTLGAGHGTVSPLVLPGATPNYPDAPIVVLGLASTDTSATAPTIASADGLGSIGTTSVVNASTATELSAFWNIDPGGPEPSHTLTATGSPAQFSGLSIALVPRRPDTAWTSTFGALTATGAPAQSADLSGTGALSATGAVTNAAPAALAAIGALAATGKIARTAAGSGSGALVGTGTPIATAATATSGSGALTGSGAIRARSTAATSGSGSLTAATGTPTVTSTAPFRGSGTLAATGSPLATASVAGGAAGQLRAVAIGVHVSDTVALSATGGLSETGNVPEVHDLAALAAVGALSADGTVTYNPTTSAVLASVGSLTAEGFLPEQDPVGITVKPAKQWGIDYGVKEG